MTKTYSLWLAAGALAASGLAFAANAHDAAPAKAVAKIQRPPARSSKDTST